MTNRDKNIVGQILAKTYRIERFLGVGTVGTVYVARHVRSGGLYAVKVLHRKLAASPDLYQRFQDEARLIATLRHPHILPITDFDRDENGIPFFVMDLLEGENLQQRLKHKEILPVAQAFEIIQQVGSAMQTAHRSGIVHRNIKPENIFLVRHDLGDRVTESAKVTDFGLARFRRMAPAGTRDASLGVSAYMAPEMLQETNTPLDGRVDQWALAVIAYRMLTGKLPWEDNNPEEMLRQILSEPPRPFPKTTPELPAHTVAAIHRGMAKRREDRYENMMDFVRALSTRPSAVAGAEPAADSAAPQPRNIPASGRVVAGMPPIPSGPVPPPPPAAAVAPAAAPPAPSTSTPPPARPAVPVTPSRSTPVPPSAASPPPPVLHAPPLLLPEEANSAPPPAPRGPSWGLIIAGGALAVMAGVGLTLLIEQRQRPRPPLPPQTVVTSKSDVSTPLVVEPLANPQTQNGGVDASLGHGPLAPQVPVPPIRPAGDDSSAANPVAPAVTHQAPVPAPTVAPPALPTIPTTPPPIAPPAMAPPTAPAPPATAPVAHPAVPAAVPPKGPVPTTVPPAAVAPAPSPAGTPGANPAAPAAAWPPPGATLSPGQQKTRDEIDDLIGPSGTPTKPPAAVAPTAVPPGANPATAQRPTTPPRPVAKPPTEPAEGSGEPAEKTSDKILEEAQAAYVSGERQRAIEMALLVTRRNNPADAVRAWRFIGSAACSVRSATLAGRAYTNLTAPEHRQLLTELCKRNGLNFHDGTFSTE